MGQIRNGEQSVLDLTLHARELRLERFDLRRERLELVAARSEGGLVAPFGQLAHLFVGRVASRLLGFGSPDELAAASEERPSGFELLSRPRRTARQPRASFVQVIRDPSSVQHDGRVLANLGRSVDPTFAR